MSGSARRASLSDAEHEVALSDVAVIQQGKTLAKKNIAGGDHPVFGANGVIGWHTEGHYDRPVIALGCRGSCGTVTVAPAGAWLGNNAMGVWEKDTDLLRLEYLRYALEAADLVAAGVIAGGVQQQITRASLGALKIGLPRIHTQMRIADLMAAADRSVVAFRREEATVEAARMALIRHLVDRAGEADSARRATLADIAELKGGVAFPHAEQGRLSGDYPYFKVADMNDEANARVMTNPANWITEDQRKRLRAKVCPPGTVIFPIIGAAVKSERRRILGAAACFDQNVLGLIPTDAVDAEYLLLAMELVRLADHARVGPVPVLNQAIVGAISVPLPPIEKQREIGALVKNVDQLLAASKQRSEAVQQVRAVLLRSLFSDGHEIPQSYDRFLSQNGIVPDLEPATV
jgi:restriction endonuclease S subunit